MKKKSFYCKKIFIVFVIIFSSMFVFFCLNLEKSLEVKKMKNLQEENIFAMEKSNLQEINGNLGEF